MFIGPSFNEEDVLDCLRELNQRQLSIILVGPTSGPVTGHYGMQVNSDISLAYALKLLVDRHCILIIAGGPKSAAAFLTDPRTYEFANKLMMCGGIIALMNRVEAIAIETDLLQIGNPRMVSQAETDIATFVQYLIRIAK